MAADPRKRQKKLEQRAAKRKEKKHLIVREQSRGLGERLTAATRFPVLHAWVNEDFWNQGMGSVMLSRELPDKTVAFAFILVDRYCLGVKNVLTAIVSRAQYDQRFERDLRSKFPSRDVAPAMVRKIVEDAIAYAGDLGFPPHEDYHTAKLLFGDIDASQCTEEFEFGKDGKPLFISGPNDTLERCNQIRDTLERSCGPGGFEYIIQVGPGGAIRPDQLGLAQNLED
jgi:hypothetical protein